MVIHVSNQNPASPWILTAPSFVAECGIFLAPPPGLEPGTYRLTADCSTN